MPVSATDLLASAQTSVLGPTSGLLAIICLVEAVLVASLLVRWTGSPAPQGRYVSIDGLRGYLAFSVFVFHSSVWYFFARTGRWELPSVRLYTHFGQTGVLLFFMITAFLFGSKVLDGREKPIDWSRLYLSRIFRLWPLYLFAMAVLFSIVGYRSHGELRVPITRLLAEGSQWLTFTILGMPRLNGVADTPIIIAGVTWSLVYEWMFYLFLPILSLIVSAPVPKKYVLLSLLAINASALLKPAAIVLLTFGGGLAAAVIVRSSIARTLLAGPVASVTAIAGAVLAVVLFPTDYHLLPIALWSVVFVIIACGNSIFGLLNTGFSRMLGDMSYSTYLLHGLLLYGAFSLALGIDRTAKLTPTLHCLVVMICAPLVVLLSFGTYHLIELPAMRLLPRAMSRIRNLSGNPLT